MSYLWLDGETNKEGDTVATRTFSFAPSLSLGFKWAIVPEKFFLNGGGSIGFFRDDTFTQPGLLSFATTTEGDDKDINNTFGAARSTLSLGFTFYPIPNLGFQAMAGVDIETNNVSTFDTSAARGLFAFSKILVTLKF